ncbi:LOW QUALITY PROTEIN: telomerase reverse transcriptase [Menidia menidia]
MAGTDLSPVLGLLRGLYAHTRPLEEFVGGVQFRGGGGAALLREGDPDRFRTFVRGIFVCFDTELEQEPSSSQICTLPELLAFVLNTMKRKRKRNVLAHGYQLRPRAPGEARGADLFQYRGEVAQSAGFVHGSGLWRRLAARLGTDLMRHLLESCCMFVAVPPSCLFQICGPPAYDRLPGARGGFCLQRGPRPRKGPRPGRGRGLEQKPETKPETRLDQRTEQRPERRPETRPETRPEQKPVQRPETRLEQKPEQRTGERPEQKPEQKPEQRPEQKPETKPEQKPEQKPEHKPETRPEQKPETRPEQGPVQRPEQKPEQKPETKPVQKPGQRVCRRPLRPPPGAPPGWRSGAAPPGWRSGAAPLWPSEGFVRTLGLLYGGRGVHSFLLNRRVKGPRGPRRLQGPDLVRLVFFEGPAYLSGTQGPEGPRRLPRRFHLMVPLFSRLLQLHRRFPYGRQLQSCCPQRLQRDASPRGGPDPDMSRLLAQHCPPQAVFRFVRACLCAVVPPPLWGSAHNRQLFLQRVRGFLRAGRAERTSREQLLWRVRVTDCLWLRVSKTGRCPPSDLQYRTRVLGQFLAWLLEGFVVGLVRACFYATESTGQKNAIRFYRQEVWAKLQESAFRVHLAKGQMEELTPDQVASLPKSTVISRLRFIPKSDGMRPITRVTGADSRTRFFQGRVRDLLDVLRACVSSAPSLLGSTVWGLGDIHRALGRLAPAQKHAPQPLYFVKVDVSGAYESLPHQKLREAVGRALAPVQEKAFTIRRYAKIYLDSHEGLKKTFVRQADFLEDSMGCTNMKGLLTSLQRSRKARRAILVEQVSAVLEEAHGILAELQSYNGAGQEIREAIQNPGDLALQEKAWNAVCPLVAKLKRFYEFSLRLDAEL